ncbi:MAG TPA: hypothetical protein VH834_11275, partial [Solirubrobacteraceae bacterium]
MALVAAAAMPAGAGAEQISPLGQGRNPSAVTDATGTLHVVYNHVPQGSPNTDTTIYCRLPAGAPACQPIAFPGLPDNADSTAPHILLRPADGALFVVVSGVVNRLPTTFLYASSDGGATWSGPAAIATGLENISSAQLTPDGGAVELMGGNGDDDMVYQRATLGGPVETRAIGLQAGTQIGFAWRYRLSRMPDGRTAAVAADSVLRSTLRVLNGPDPYQQASWSPWATAPSVSGQFVGASAGPSGSWVLIAPHERLRLRRWNGRTFGTPRTMGTLAGVGGGDVGPVLLNPPADIAVDLAGRVHVAFLAPHALCGPSVCLAYRRSEPRGLGPTFIYPVAKPGGVTPFSITVAPNAGGSGWIVWDDRSLGYTGNVNAVPLVTPPRYSRTGSRVLGHHRRITLPVRRGCIRPGSRFVHRADLSGLRRGVRIVSVRFFFDDGQL